MMLRVLTAELAGRPVRLHEVDGLTPIVPTGGTAGRSDRAGTPGTVGQSGLTPAWSVERRSEVAYRCLLAIGTRLRNREEMPGWQPVRQGTASTRRS